MAKRKSPPKHPRLPNGFGRITEIKGKNLRNPFRAMLTVGRDEEGTYKGKILGYYPTWYAAYDALAAYHKNPYELRADKTTLEQLYQRWSVSYFRELKNDSSVRTITAAWEYVTPSFRKCSIDSLQPQALKDFISLDAQRIDENGHVIKPSDQIRSRIKSIFNLMFDYAVLAGAVQYNPARQFTLKGLQGKIERIRKEKNAITAEHEQILWDDIDYGYTRMILINIYSSWRPEELLRLEKSSINLDDMTMIGGMKTDAGTDRLVPIHPKIQDLIRYYYEKSPGERLFYNYDQPVPAPMTYDQYRGRFKKIMTRHGWDCYSPSCPRHTFASKAKEAHMDDLARKMIMGHEITDVTDKHYTHLDRIKFLSAEIRKIK